MSQTDPIADMLTRIRNGAKAKRRAVDIPASKLKREIARILVEKKYIKHVEEFEDGKQGIIRVFLRYNKDDKSVISGIDRLSRPGLRKYVNSTEAPYMGRRKLGMTIISTSSGVMTNIEAGRKRIGGELICRVW
jgi:small subunit ribosomal protein S8